MSDGWEALRESLGALLHTCEDEQHALVMLDGDKLAKLEIQKAHLVKQVAVVYKTLDVPEEKSPADVRALAERCKRVNEANRRMLILTVQCINGMLESAGYGKPAKYGPGADSPARRRMMDLRV